MGGWTCIAGHGGCTAPRFLEWLEKKPVTKEDCALVGLIVGGGGRVQKGLW